MSRHRKPVTTCLDCARKEECLVTANGGVIPDCSIAVAPALLDAQPVNLDDSSDDERSETRA